MRPASLPFFAFVLSVAFGIGCTTKLEGQPSSNEPGSAGSAASADDIVRCKSSCDKMKFFECNSADEQARCYADCNAATPDEIQVFTGCAENSICDPQCRTTIQPKDTTKTGGGGANAATCTTACDKLVSCNLIPVGAKAQCNSECTQNGYQYQIDCMNSTACASIVSTCGGSTGSTPPVSVGVDPGTTGDDPVKACLDECDQINFFDCATVAAYSDCRKECSGAAAAKRDTFTSCSKSSGAQCDRKEACLDEFLQ
jgi:hypothetical protein